MAINLQDDVEVGILAYLRMRFPTHKFKIGPLVYDPQDFMPKKPVWVDGMRAFLLPQIFTTKMSNEAFDELVVLCEKEVERALRLELIIGS